MSLHSLPEGSVGADKAPTFLFLRLAILTEGFEFNFNDSFDLIKANVVDSAGDVIFETAFVDKTIEQCRVSCASAIALINKNAYIMVVEIIPTPKEYCNPTIPLAIEILRKTSLSPQKTYWKN